MEIIKEPSGELVFKGQMTVSVVEAIHSKLEPLLEEVLPDVVLDLSGVNEIDVAGLQLIIAVKNSSECEGSFRIKAISPPVKECITLSGFEMVLKEAL
jgi:anti-anti-sigma factor